MVRFSLYLVTMAWVSISSQVSVAQQSSPFNTLIITEFLPVTSDLHPHEYVEIYNPGTDDVSTAGLILSDESRSVILPATTIRSGDYRVIAGQEFAALHPETHVLLVESLPSLNNNGDVIRIRNASGELIHQLAYDLAWKQRNTNNWAWEMQNIRQPCAGMENWKPHQTGSAGKVNHNQRKIPDRVSPWVTDVYSVTNDSLVVVLNENIAPEQWMRGSFEVNRSEIAPAIYPDQHHFNMAGLQLPDSLVPGIQHQLVVRSLTDCSGNFVVEQPSFFQLTRPAGPRDVLLSEVMYEPVRNAPEYVELYNPTSYPINVKGWLLSVRNASGKEQTVNLSGQDRVLEPGRLLVLTNNFVQQVNAYPHTPENTILHIPGLPVLPNEGGVITLRHDSVAGEKFNFTPALHHAQVTNTAGVSLERISFARSTLNADNWHSASSAAGYHTPGRKNSQQNDRPLHEASQITLVNRLITPNLDGVADYLLVGFAPSLQGTVISAYVYDSKGRLVKNLASNQLVGTNSYYRWDAVNEQGKRVNSGQYVLLVKVIDDEGRTRKLMKTIAVNRVN